MSRHLSTILCIAVAALIVLGLTMLTSTGAWVHNIDNPYHFLTRQALLAAVGVIGAFVVSRLPTDLLRKITPALYLGACVMLVLCYVPGIGVSSFGAKRWIELPALGSFQPSEFARIVIVLCLASWFARWQTETQTFFRGFVIPGMIVGIPILLIAGETDVGSALSCSVTVAILLFAIGTRLRYLIPTALIAMAGASAYIATDPVRWHRIQAWLDLENHQTDVGMQQWRALLALGNGGPSGVGLGNGVEKFGTLTFAHIDFIFPVIGEELGLPGTLGVVLCFVLIAICGCGIAMQAKSVFERCLGLGVTAMLVVPAMVNIAVTTATLPNDGLPLPFVSYGGTSLVFSLASVGILVGIHRRSLNHAPVEYPLSKQTRLAVKL